MSGPAIVGVHCSVMLDPYRKVPGSWPEVSLCTLGMYVHACDPSGLRLGDGVRMVCEDTIGGASVSFCLALSLSWNK